jgi:hypothetical protein
MYQLLLCVTVTTIQMTDKLKELFSVSSDVTPTNCIKKIKLHGLSPRANYTDGATAACRRSVCQLLRIEGAKWSA